MSDEILDKQKFNISEFLKKHKLKFILSGVLIFFSIITMIIYNEYKEKQNINTSERFNKAKILIENGKSEDALEILEEIIFEENKFYSPSALNLVIDSKLVKDKKKVLSYYDQILLNNNLELDIKNLFLIKKIIFIGEDIEENELLKNLNPIIKSNSLWKNTALDYIKKYYLSKGELNKAKEFEVLLNK